MTTYIFQVVCVSVIVIVNLFISVVVKLLFVVIVIGLGGLIVRRWGTRWGGLRCRKAKWIIFTGSTGIVGIIIFGIFKVATVVRVSFWISPMNPVFTFVTLDRGGIWMKSN